MVGMSDVANRDGPVITRHGPANASVDGVSTYRGDDTQEVECRIVR